MTKTLSGEKIEVDEEEEKKEKEEAELWVKGKGKEYSSSSSSTYVSSTTISHSSSTSTSSFSISSPLLEGAVFSSCSPSHRLVSPNFPYLGSSAIAAIFFAGVALIIGLGVFGVYKSE